MNDKAGKVAGWVATYTLLYMSIICSYITIITIHNIEVVNLVEKKTHLTYVLYTAADSNDQLID